MAQRYFAVTTPGLEETLLQELRGFKVKKPKVMRGGVEFQATARGFYQVLHFARTTHRLYLRVDEFRARDVHELYKKTRRIDWERLLPVDAHAPVQIRGVSHRSNVSGSGELVERVLDGVRDHFTLDLATAPPTLLRERDHVQNPITLMVRMSDDRCELSLEAAGRALHQRGWREESGEAPLRETLASAMLEMCGWQPGTPLLDPMCGSGTFLIEAARKTLERSPRCWSDYAALRWANANPELFEEVRGEVSEEAAPAPEEVTIFGQDRDVGVLLKASRNARRAGVQRLVQLKEEPVSQLLPPLALPGLMICNPPYGERLRRDGAIQELLARAEEHFEGWRLALVLPRDFDMRTARVPMEELGRFTNGGLPVTLWQGAVSNTQTF